MKQDDNYVCEECSGDDPCCRHHKCEAPHGERGITNCRHCYAELREVEGYWYHWTQFRANGDLKYDQRYQDFVH